MKIARNHFTCDILLLTKVRGEDEILDEINSPFQ